MSPKKSQVKLQLSQEGVRKLKELRPKNAVARTASDILEAVADYKGDFATLIFIISHPEDKIVRNT